jgi:hypothetical protein
MGLLHEGRWSFWSVVGFRASLVWEIGKADCPLFSRMLLVGVVSRSRLKNTPQKRSAHRLRRTRGEAGMDAKDSLFERRIYL